MSDIRIRTMNIFSTVWVLDENNELHACPYGTCTACYLIYRRWNLILTSYISLIKSRALSDTVEWMSTDWLAQYKTTSYALFIFGSFGLELTVENKALQTRFLKPATEQNVKSNSNTWRKKNAWKSKECTSQEDLGSQF